MRILDRYVLQKFLLPFVYCFLGFIAIWFIFDLSDNLPDFLQGKAGFDVLLEYYKSQISEIIVVSLPIGALLALLYSLTAMSRSNEIISMLGAGVSVTRILVPLILVGLVLTAITGYFNYEQAPHAAMTKKRMLRDIKRGKTTEVGLTGHLYRNREDLRTWFSRKVYVDAQRLLDVQIVQQDADGNIIRQWYARDAYHNDITKSWNLQRARYVEIDLEGRISKSEMHDEIEIAGWRETPWRIASSVMNPDYLSVPELEDYLVFNRDFPDPPQTSLHPPELQPGRTLHRHSPLSTLPQANPRRIHGIRTRPRIRLHRSLGRAPENRPLCRVDRPTAPTADIPVRRKRA
jgi:lipopolysaccharide export system permease protein